MGEGNFGNSGMTASFQEPVQVPMGDLGLAGKVCVVTGGTRGIGLATVEWLAAAGADVVVAARDGEACERVASELPEAGGNASACRVDLTDLDSVAHLDAYTAERYGRIDSCINNAGVVFDGEGDFAETSFETWRQAIEMNLTGMFACLKHQIPYLIEGGGGSIVNLSSMVARLGSATPQVPYDAAKAGQLALTQDVAVVHAKDGIRCNAVLPGPIDGPSLGSVVNDEASAQMRFEHIPGRRFGRPQEVAAAIAFLASPAAGWTNGAALTVDGGITVAYNTRP